MDIPVSGDPFDLDINVAALPVSGLDVEGEKTPTVRELIEILQAIPEDLQDLPVTRYAHEGIGRIRYELGYWREERDPDPRMSKYTAHIELG